MMVSLILGNLVSDQKCPRDTTLIKTRFCGLHVCKTFEGETLSHQTLYLIILASRASANQDENKIIEQDKDKV